jgi:AraC-like DNA-binding protein
VASADRFAHEILATVFHGVLCWLVGQPVRLSSAEFAYPRPAHGDEYQTMFCRALRFDAERTTLHFDARWLSQPLRLDDDRCRRFLATAPLSIFVRHRNPDSWTVRVRKHLRGLSPADWPTIDKAARQLGIAPSTFVRCLAAEGVSYQRVKDDLRRDRALHLLRSTGHGMAEIASELGFEEASAFHRAFKRWTGISPGRYR